MVGGAPSMLRISLGKVVFFILFCGVVLFGVNYEFRAPQLRGTSHPQHRSSAGQIVTAPLQPHGKVIDGVEMFYRLPSTDKVQGILLFFHGCGHGGQDAFLLPEDRIVVMAALNRGLAVLSITSSDRVSGCWSEHDTEILLETQAVQKWMKAVGLSANLPLMGMGASSGGAFLFHVYKVIKFKSMVCYINDYIFSPSELSESASSIPATAYVHMPRDSPTATAIAENQKALTDAGIQNKVWEVQPHPLTTQLCDRRLPELGDRRCEALLRRAKSQYPGLLDPNDNTVLKDYRGGKWKGVMQDAKLDKDLENSVGDEETNPGEVGMKAFMGHTWLWTSVEEVIAASYAYHEMTAEHRSEVLDFLMEHAGLIQHKEVGA